MSTVVHAPLYTWKGKRSRAQCTCGWQSSHWYSSHQNARDEWNAHRDETARQERRAQD